MILWWSFRLPFRYEELGGLGDQITLFKYGQENYYALLTSQVIGLISGIICYLKTKLNLGIIGSLICLIGFTILWFEPM